MGKDTRPGYITIKKGLQIFEHQVAFYMSLKDVYKEQPPKGGGVITEIPRTYDDKVETL